MPDPIAETAGAAIVASHINATPQQRDIPGAPPGTHDYDLHLPDGRVFALEITTAASATVLSLQHSIASQNKQWVSGLLTSTWLVVLDRPPATIFPRKVVKAIEGPLRTLETEGIDGFELTRPDEVDVHPSGIAVSQAADAAITLLRETGVGTCRAANYLNPDGRAVILLGTAGQAFFVNPDNFNHVVSAEVAANAKKLASANADERHLFVWVDWSIGAVGVDVTSTHPPAKPPVIAGAVNTVWVAFPGPGGLGSAPQRLWRVCPPQSWEVLTPRARSCR